MMWCDKKGTFGAFTLVACLLSCIVPSVLGAAAELRIVPSSKTSLQTTVNANFPFETPLQIEALDGSGARDTSATDSITAHTNGTACLLDETFTLVAGVGTFKGSFCKPEGGVVNLWFTAGALTSDLTPDLTVKGDIHLASFFKNNIEQSAEEARWAKLYLNMYNEGVLPKDFKKRMPDRMFHIKNYIHQGTLSGAIKAFKSMRDHEKANPQERAHSIIGTSDTKVTKFLLPLFTKDKYSLMSVRNDDDIAFSANTLYNRFSASKAYYYHAIGEFLNKRKWNKVAVIYDEKTVPGPEFETKLNDAGVKIVAQYAINNNDFPAVKPEWKENPVLDHICNGIKGSGTQIILNFASGNAFETLLGASMRNNMTSYRTDDEVDECFAHNEYFQWIILGKEARINYPADNSPKICHAYEEESGGRGLDTWCAKRFAGTLFLTEYYDYTDAGVNLEWYMAELEYFHSNFMLEYGNQLFNQYPLREKSFITEVVRCYDASKIHVQAIKALIDGNKTITGDLVAEEIRKVTSLRGLSSTDLSLDKQGDKTTFKLLVETLFTKFEWRKHQKGSPDYKQWKKVAKFPDWFFNPENKDFQPILENRIVEFSGIGTEPVEVIVYTPHKGKNINDKNPDMTALRVELDTMQISLQDALTYSEKCVANKYPASVRTKQSRSFSKIDGFYALADQTYRLPNSKQEYNSAKWYWKSVQFPAIVPATVNKEATEMIMPNWFCRKGCGGEQDKTDINMFKNGECKGRDTCECKSQKNKPDPDWVGQRCEIPNCPKGCVQGNCKEPGFCDCYEGYQGVNCATPICPREETIREDKGSVNGKCLSPGQFECYSGYYGELCSGKCMCSEHGVCKEGKNGNGECKCNTGYYGDDCSVNLGVIIGGIVGGLIGLLGICILAIVAYTKSNKRTASLKNNDWIINWADLKRHDEMMGKSGRSSMFLSALSMNKNTTKKAMNTGVWNGIDVHYQRIESDSVAASMEVRTDVKKMRELKDTNIVVFVGACLEAPNVCIVTEIAPKGSLEDMLTNEDIKIPWDFRYPIMKGICQGMIKLHGSEVECHGRLKSSNVLIDGRWTPKITGFGMHTVRQNAKNVPFFDHLNPNANAEIDTERANFDSLLWTSPELLIRGYSHIDHVGSGNQQNDVYSFGMLMSEICTREHPFADVMLEKVDIIDLIKGKRNDAALKVWNDYIAAQNMESGGLIRPMIKDADWPKKYEQRKALKKLMHDCWHQDPSQRPSFTQCHSEIGRIDPMQSEIMDRLVKMLEKYSTNLEDVVTRRTKQLAKEKQKTEDLVSRLLPKSVSEDLKQGKRVMPENFEAVTIFFSDIVGFTSIARASTPIQVVTLLNDMYTSFDAISSNYDVYKVETIGDAYMIVSGLPIRNGDKHAGEIATCAMDLICSIKDFKIRHMPDTVMQLRVGLHTGHCVAGVVGLKMPRYCLFGETVNTAAEMESGGAAMRIHISEDTQAVLDRIGGYHMQHRGVQEVKGRQIKTYWLSGKDNYGKDLPIPPPLDE